MLKRALPILLLGAVVLVLFSPWKSTDVDPAAVTQLLERGRAELPPRLHPRFRIPVGRRPEPFRAASTSVISLSGLAHSLESAVGSSENASLLELLGHVQMANQRDAAARKSYERALELDPSRIEARLGLAALLSEEDPQEQRRALAYLREIPAGQPEHAASLYDQCLLLIALDETEQAEETLARYEQEIGPDVWSRSLRSALPAQD